MQAASYVKFGSWGTAEPSTPTEAAIQDAIRQIPSGKTASYEHVAIKAGIGPGGAQAVGKCIGRHINAPAWRVVWKDGTLRWPDPEVQRVLLECEGVRFANERVDPVFILT